MKENEILFMEYMEKEVLPNRRNVGYDVLIKAGSYVGISINTGCRSCAAKSGTDLLNKYGQLKNQWIQYKEEQAKLVAPKVEELFPETPVKKSTKTKKVVEEPIDFTLEVDDSKLFE